MGKEKKKHKKKSREDKKPHKKTTKKKSSSDDSSSSEQWVECDTVPPATSQPLLQQGSAADGTTCERDEWSSNPVLLACSSREQLRQGRERKNEKNEADKYMLDKLGQTDRELNPYWRDGGSGLPEENPATVESLRQSSVTVGDQGAAWLRKALQRAREQATESGRSLEEVVAERWGSLGKLERMISAAEERDRNKKQSVNDNSRYRRKDEYGNRKQSYEQRDRRQERDEKVHRENDSSVNKSFSRPRESSEDSSDCDNKYRRKKEFERKNENMCSNRDNISDSRRKSEEKRKMYKRGKESSESSDDSSEKDRKRHNKYGKQRNKGSPRKTSSKPRSGSSSSEDNTGSYRKYKGSSSPEDNTGSYRKYKGSSYKQDKGTKSSNRGFSKPANSSDEDERSYRDRGRKENDSNKAFGRNKSLHDSKRTFVRPRRDSEEDSYQSKSRETKSRDYKSSGGGWRKKAESHTKDEEVLSKKNDVKTEKAEEHISEVEVDNKALIHEVEPVLTDKELNELAAKLVKAELLGNQELAEELKTKLAKARDAKANAPKDSDASKEVVILTHTDAKGFIRPVSLSGPLEPSGGRRKGKKVETHAGGKRMRYFADDDKYSLQEMFQREKLNTVEDSNEVFAKLASKGIGRDDSARDMEDVFEETARVEEGEGRQKARERQRAVEQSRRTARTLDHCQWCLDSQHMLKHLIVAIGTTCYLCVPPYQSLTDHHCLIVPRTHTPCATQLDEDVWAEIQDFRKAVVQMFLSQDEDVMFFESARRLNQFPHMVLNCVPVPKETGDMAPIYFKKAIQECEQEWSNNKKLVELKGRDVRRAVPKGLPYFAVDFGLDSGYAHVIEDEQLFPLNFAQEIIGGMLDLDHSIWRKQRRQTFEEQSKKVIQLGKLWSPFDITKKK